MKSFVHKLSSALAASALVLGLTAATALAHAHLAKATPAAGATVATAPSGLTLEFNEAIEPKFSGAVLTGTDKALIKTGTPVLENGNRKILLLPVTDALKPGTYTVEWHALSADGHKVKGSYDFTVKP